MSHEKITEDQLLDIKEEAYEYEIGFAINEKENTVAVIYKNNPTFRRFSSVEQAECYVFGLIDAEGAL